MQPGLEEKLFRVNLREIKSRGLKEREGKQKNNQYFTTAEKSQGQMIGNNSSLKAGNSWLFQAQEIIF